MARKTDNFSMAAKLDLRRFFLRKYHAQAPPRVIDCCQGSGKLWEALRREFAVASYWGMDEKPRPGRLKIDSARVLAQPGWRADVVDIDTYGSPWEHWLALLPHVKSPLTVFLTVGLVSLAGAGGVSAAELQVAGCVFRKLRFRGSPALLGRPAVREYMLACMLALPLSRGLKIVEAAEAPPGRSARYLGVRLAPA